MKNYTKNGLLLLLISQIISIISTFLIYSIFYSFDIENITTENVSSFIFMILPLATIGSIVGILGLVGAILIYVGRKEFGEKHRKFVTYALILVVISIIVQVGIVLISIFMSVSSFGQIDFTSETSFSLAYLGDSMRITYMVTPIAAILSGLIWVFGLYQLEDKTGRLILFAAYASLIVTSIVTTFYGLLNIEEILAMEIDYSSSSQLLSNYQWIGQTAIVSLIGNTLTGILFIIALYIPYNRIRSGELTPMQSDLHQEVSSRRKCPQCNNEIPFNAEICPHCGKIFESYL